VRIVDYDVLRELAGVGTDSGCGFMTELMDRFASDARGTLERMRACARAGDSPRLAREAHRLKGSSATVGAVALASECLEMERCARAGSCAGIEAKLDAALTLLDTTHSHITQFFRGKIAAPA